MKYAWATPWVSTADSLTYTSVGPPEAGCEAGAHGILPRGGHGLWAGRVAQELGGGGDVVRGRHVGNG